jgi:hypothetical protein
MPRPIQCLVVKVTTVEELTRPHHLYLIKNSLQEIALLWSYKYMRNFTSVLEKALELSSSHFLKLYGKALVPSSVVDMLTVLPCWQARWQAEPYS